MSHFMRPSSTSSTPFIKRLRIFACWENSSCRSTSVMPAKEVASEPASPRSGSTTLVEGFASADTRALIQENVYIILGHGRFQQIVLFSAFVAISVALLHSLDYYLIGRPVDHWCQPPDDLRYLGVQGWKNVAIPVLADGSFSKCTVYEPPLPEDKQQERSIVPCKAWDYDTEKDGESIVSMWNMVCSRSWLYSASKYTLAVAPMLFVPIAGIAADRIGRRPVLSACAVSMLLGSLVTTQSSTVGVFILSRLVTRAMGSATMLMALTVLYEVTGNQHRAPYILAAGGIAMLVTPPLVHGLSTLKPTWLLSQALFVTVTAIMASWCCYLDESPVWQIATWRLRAAESTILRAARFNGIDAHKAAATFKAFKQQLMKREASITSVTANTTSIVRSASLRRRALSAVVTWFSLNFAFRASGLGATIEELWLLASFLLRGLILITAFYGIRQRGHRVTLSGVIALLGASSALQMLLCHPRLAVALPLPRIMMSSATAIAICLNYAYTAEVFPTKIRSVGLCLSYSVGRLAVILAAYIQGSLHEQQLLVVAAITTGLAFASALSVRCLPEVFVEEKPAEDRAVLSESQRKEALIASLSPTMQSEKILKSPKPRKQRKRKGSSKRGNLTETSAAPSTPLACTLNECAGSPERTSPTSMFKTPSQEL
ncbi:solute carrier family 22 member 7-like [Dermacentor andersoni]|uniref:solute carrier family 22 member 7-like n=1 Tax=Dermacentor andersoni TaxID=34620 RepID=UPI002417F5C7|nr:solute carrier family 22 member 7-like [Dermacentor andersoni]